MFKESVANVTDDGLRRGTYRQRNVTSVNRKIEGW